MRILFSFLTIGLIFSTVLEPHNVDFLSSKNHAIIYADGTAKEILDVRQPIIQSWRPSRLEIINMCKTVTCDYTFIRESIYQNRFVSNKCYLAQGVDCIGDEFSTLTTLEQIIHEADFATSIELAGETFGLIGNSKTEDAIIIEVDVKIVGDGPNPLINKN